MNRRGRPPYPDILTPREWEVLELLRLGQSNEQIAERLGITLRTAKFHVSDSSASSASRAANRPPRGSRQRRRRPPDAGSPGRLSGASREHWSWWRRWQAWGCWRGASCEPA